MDTESTATPHQDEDHFQRLIDCVPLGVHRYKVDERGDLVFFGHNRAADRILGVSHEQFLGKTIGEAFPNLLDTEVPAQYKRTAVEGEGWATEQFVYSDSRIVGAFDCRAFQVRPGEMAVLFDDVTERKETERELRFFRHAFEQSADGMHLLRADGTLFYANPANAAMLGYTVEELLNCHVSDFDPNFTTEAWPQVWERVKAAGGANFETTNRRRDGSLIPLEIRTNILRHEGEEFAFSFLRDLTEQKKAEAEIRAAHDHLEERVRMRTAELEQASAELRDATAQVVQSAKLAAVGELSAGIAHELNQPLNGAKIAVQSLLRDIAKDRLDPDELHDKLGNVVSLVNRMAGIIEHMRIFSRRTFGTSFVVVNINEVVTGAFTFIEQQMRNSNIEVRKELDPNGPKVHGDPIALEQVLLNLLSNARFALIQSEKEDLQLVVRTSVQGGEVVVQVSDNGTGIPDDARNSIFLPFFTTKEVGQGTGLGLSVSHKIIGEHHGTLQFESRMGEFTTMEVRLPATHTPAGAQ